MIRATCTECREERSSFPGDEFDEILVMTWARAHKMFNPDHDVRSERVEK
jgi:hypothetical protein